MEVVAVHANSSSVAARTHQNQLGAQTSLIFHPNSLELLLIDVGGLIDLVFENRSLLC